MASARWVFRLPVDNFIRPLLEANSAAAPTFVTALLMIYGIGGPLGTSSPGFTVAHHVRTTFVVSGAGLIDSATP